nr:PREDICTED: vomeronasal type-2 receptor 26-like [Latimeria chalumnae]|eukprot:XP_006009626.2 PREDICTED: vomeronasal type-2 receptor 26-like [Latimeria chalumnae]
MLLCVMGVFLLLSSPVHGAAQTGCTLRSLNTKGYFRAGDIIIGGLFPLYYNKVLPDANFTELPKVARCEIFRVSHYQWLQSMVFAIEEINRNTKLLPNITLGFAIYASCGMPVRAIKGTMWMVTGQEEAIPNYRCQVHYPLAAVIGDAPSSISMPVANILGIYGYPQLLHYVKNVHFKNNAGDEIFFDKNGNPPPAYDIVNWHLLPDGSAREVKIGSIDFSATQGLHLVINESAIMWNGGNTQIPRSVCSEGCSPGYRKAIRPREPICCFDCVLCANGEISNQTDSTDCMKCPDDQWSNDRQDMCIPKTFEFLSYKDPMGETLSVLASFFAVIPITILCIFIKYRDTPIVKANNRELSYLLLLALVLCFLCSLIFIDKPRIWTCMARQAAFGIIFALCVSCVLAKTIMVVIAFNATKPNSNLKKWVGPKLASSIVLVCTVIQVIICVAWLATFPPFPEYNMKSQIGIIIIECNQGSSTAFWCVLGYMGLLAIICFIVAFLARNLPGSFNEAKFITFSMLVFVSVWLAFIPAYLSTKGKYMVAVEIFAILASSAGLLACIFFPKCYIIVLRPDMNTKEYLMGKETFRNKKST